MSNITPMGARHCVKNQQKAFCPTPVNKVSTLTDIDKKKIHYLLYIADREFIRRDETIKDKYRDIFRRIYRITEGKLIPFEDALYIIKKIPQLLDLFPVLYCETTIPYKGKKVLCLADRKEIKLHYHMLTHIFNKYKNIRLFFHRLACIFNKKTTIYDDYSAIGALRMQYRARTSRLCLRLGFDESYSHFSISKRERNIKKYIKNYCNISNDADLCDEANFYIKRAKDYFACVYGMDPEPEPGYTTANCIFAMIFAHTDILGCYRYPSDGKRGKLSFL